MTSRSMKKTHAQGGFMLLEALIAMLLFAIGVLAIVGLQANAIKLSTDAKYRSDASLLANELIGRMWVADKTPATLLANFDSHQGTTGSGYATWKTSVASALPGVAANPPVVTITSTATGVNLVNITIYWQSPNEADAHQYMVNAQIR